MCFGRKLGGGTPWVRHDERYESRAMATHLEQVLEGVDQHVDLSTLRKMDGFRRWQLAPDANLEHHLAVDVRLYPYA